MNPSSASILCMNHNNKILIECHFVAWITRSMRQTITSFSFTLFPVNCCHDDREVKQVTDLHEGCSQFWQLNLTTKRIWRCREIHQKYRLGRVYSRWWWWQLKTRSITTWFYCLSILFSSFSYIFLKMEHQENASCSRLWLVIIIHDVIMVMMVCSFSVCLSD